MRNFYRNSYYRNNVPSQPLPPPLPPKPPIPPPPPKPPSSPPKPCKPPKPNKFDFDCFKNDTCKSLKEVECFLNNFSDFFKYVKLINLLKNKK